jgi:hypothetical protein
MSPAPVFYFQTLVISAMDSALSPVGDSISQIVGNVSVQSAPVFSSFALFQNDHPGGRPVGRLCDICRLQKMPGFIHLKYCLSALFAHFSRRIPDRVLCQAICPFLAFDGRMFYFPIAPHIRVVFNIVFRPFCRSLTHSYEDINIST